MHRLALLLLLTLSLAPALWRRTPAPARPACVGEGRGAPPRRWLGCRADRGSSRDLAGDERLLLGLPLDVDRATAGELAFVPGLSPRLADEVVADRERGGPFGAPEALLRVKGIGPKRLARARPFLAADPLPVGVAASAEQR